MRSEKSRSPLRPVSASPRLRVALALAIAVACCFLAPHTPHPTPFTLSLIALALLRINDNEIRITPIKKVRNNAIETSCVFAVTLKDSNGDPVPNLAGLLTTYDPNRQDNYVIFPGVDLDLDETENYTLDAFATDAFADKINFEDVPVRLQKRQ